MQLENSLNKAQIPCSTVDVLQDLDNGLKKSYPTEFWIAFLPLRKGLQIQNIQGSKIDKRVATDFVCRSRCSVNSCTDVYFIKVHGGKCCFGQQGNFGQQYHGWALGCKWQFQRNDSFSCHNWIHSVQTHLDSLEKVQGQTISSW